MMAEVYVGGVHIGTATEVKVVPTDKPLPKPARVEKWQRWRDSRGVEFTVIGPREDVLNMDTYPLRKDGEDGLWRGNNLLGGKSWTFLGYANPDKVEVGQRWRHLPSSNCLTVEEDRDSYVVLRNDNGRMGTAEGLCTDDAWEYLGMADSTNVKQEAPRFEAVVLAGRQSVIAAKTEYVTVDDLSAPPVQTKRTADQALQDARRANEEAAKRLIANPPGWAYQRSWMCAVLAMLEMDGRVLDTMCPGAQAHDMLETYHHRRAILGMTHEAATTRIVGDALKIVDAYNRGTERPTPLMTRQGVKGGVSTCDLGGEYE